MILEKDKLFHHDLKLKGKIKLYVGKNKEKLLQIKDILQQYLVFLNKQEESKTKNHLLLVQ